MVTGKPFIERKNPWIHRADGKNLVARLGVLIHHLWPAAFDALLSGLPAGKTYARFDQTNTNGSHSRERVASVPLSALALTFQTATSSAHYCCTASDFVAGGRVAT